MIDASGRRMVPPINLRHTFTRPLLPVILYCQLFATFSSAHPHLFIDVTGKFLLTDSTVSGFNVFWDIDEMTSAGLIEEFDLNHNRRFEKNEVETIEKVAFSYAASSNYFTVCTWGSKNLPVTPRNFFAEIRSDVRVRYNFFIPFNFRLEEASRQKTTVFFDDPSMFVAFDLQKKLIQASTNQNWQGSVSFEKKNYSESIILSIERKHREQ